MVFCPNVLLCRLTRVPLAKRAKLRLLEDAMAEACEREGEDDIIGDLTINDKRVTKASYVEDDNNFSARIKGMNLRDEGPRQKRRKKL